MPDFAHDPPLPPAPLAAYQGSETRHELLGPLGELRTRLGAGAGLRMLPGALPSLEVPPEHLLAVATFLRDALQFDLLSSISGVDMLTHREVVYHLRSLPHNWLMQLKVRVPETNMIESVMGVWAGANPLERETYDLFGILFLGHPDLRRILLDDEFLGYPLLKSFRTTPQVVHDQATTQIDPERALAAGSQRGIGVQRVTSNRLSQGALERLHPGTPTLGDTQFHGRLFPPETWKHRPEYRGTGDNTANGAMGDEPILPPAAERK
ncbi:MAG: NADH-quinone oxidoreductase subunit C [Ktedonobacterales bacterium]|nr:NADH-quinone oxidoreductase subunit C [Ktedonobacterales bacterium]